jgi:hypothetical protein
MNMLETNSQTVPSKNLKHSKFSLDQETARQYDDGKGMQIATST